MEKYDEILMENSSQKDLSEKISHQIRDKRVHNN